MRQTRQNYGLELAKARKALGLTQAEVAKEIGVPRETLSNIERGSFTGSLRLLERYAERLGFIMSLQPIKNKTFPEFDELGELFGETLE